MPAVSEVASLLETHSSQIAPKLAQSIVPVARSSLSSLGFKGQELEQKVAQVSQSAASSALKSLGAGSDEGDIQQAILDGVNYAITGVYPEKKNGSKKARGAEIPRDQIPIDDIKLSQNLRTIDHIQRLNASYLDQVPVVSLQLQNHLQQYPNIDSQRQDIIKKDLGYFLDDYKKTFNSRIAAESTGNFPNWEKTQEIREEAYQSAFSSLGLKTYDPSTAQLAQKVAVSLGMTAPDYETAGRLGLISEPRTLSFANNSDPNDASTAIFAATNDKKKKQLYAVLLSLHKNGTTLKNEILTRSQLINRLRSKGALTPEDFYEIQKEQQKLKVLHDADRLAHSDPKARQKAINWIQGTKIGAPAAANQVWEVTYTSFGENPGLYMPVSSYQTVANRSINALSFNIGDYTESASSLGHSATNIGSTASKFRKLGNLFGKGAKGGAKTAGKAGARIGVAAAAGTAEAAAGPPGWLLFLATTIGPAVKNLASKIVKTAIKLVAALVAYLILMFGLKILGALTGLAFGLVTGAPLLLIPGVGIPLYIGYVAFWTIYGWMNPMSMLNIAYHPLAFATSVWGGIKGAFTGAIGAVKGGFGLPGTVLETAGIPAGATTTGAAIGFLVGGPAGALIGAAIGFMIGGGWVIVKNFIVSGVSTTGSAAFGAGGAIGSTFGALGSFITGTTASIWGGITGAGGGVLGAIGNVTGALASGLSGLSISGSIASVSVGGAFLTIGLGGYISTQHIAASHFNPDTEAGQVAVGDNEFYTISKSADPAALSNDDIDSTQEITFTIVLEAKDSNLDNISFTDALTVSGENVNNSILRDNNNETIPPCDPPEDNNLGAGESWTCEFIIETDSDWINALVTNTITVQAAPEGESEPTIDQATAITRIGDPATSCPQGWPSTGYLTQGPEGYSSHAENSDPFVGYNGTGMEAVDIGAVEGTTVFSTLDGTVESINVGTGRSNGDHNQIINVTVSGCPGLTRVSFIHLSAIHPDVQPGQPITFGQEIGASGDPGGAPHNHYQFNSDNDRSFRMEIPYVPDSFPRNCNGREACGVDINSAPL